MKRLLEALKIGLMGLLVFLTCFVICCLGGMFAISIVNIFTYNITAVLIAGVTGYVATIALITILALIWLKKRKQKNSQEDTRE